MERDPKLKSGVFSTDRVYWVHFNDDIWMFSNCMQAVGLVAFAEVSTTWAQAIDFSKWPSLTKHCMTCQPLC